MELREQILEDLSKLYAEDRLSENEFEARVTAIMAAETQERLLAVNADILPQQNYNPVAHYAANAQQSRELVGIFSGANLKGVFDLPRTINAAAIFGGVDIDLCKATIPQDGCVIEVAAIFGGVDIKVPDYVQLICDGVGIFGGIEKPQHSGNPNGPIIRINCTAIFGGVTVKFSKKHNYSLED